MLIFGFAIRPVHMDYGYNVKCGKDVYFNFGCTFVDVGTITFGSRTLVGPNASFYAATHPLDPVLRNGTKGPEIAKEIHVGEDCWIGGNVIILPGVTVGNGAVLGAGSVVTKVGYLAPPFIHSSLMLLLQDVPSFHVVAGNPARVIKKIPQNTDADSVAGAEVLMARMAEKLEDNSGL